MEKLIFRKQKYQTNTNVCRVRVDSEAKEIIEDISAKTNMTEKDVVSSLIKFASNYIEIKE